MEPTGIGDPLFRYKARHMHERLAMNTPNDSNCVAVFDWHEDAETAIRELQRAGFDMKKLSIVGRDYHTEEHAVGFYNSGDRVKYWGKQGAFWGSSSESWSHLPSSSFPASVRFSQGASSARS